MTARSRIAQAALLAVLLASTDTAAKGVRLGDLTWVEARDAFARDADVVIVIPLGAGAKEHGPHLKLDADWRQAEALADRVLAETDAIIAPTVSYGFYPAFVEYPGSTHVSENVARDLIVDVVRSLARHGPRRFYVLNVGISTKKPLAQARELLALDGIALQFFDLGSPAIEAVAQSARTQPEGTHADELETSVMLAIDPRRVDMKKAVKELGPGGGPRGTPFSPKGEGLRPSPSGVYGDATLATKQKGRKLLDGYARVAIDEVRALKAATLPTPSASAR